MSNHITQHFVDVKFCKIEKKSKQNNKPVSLISLSNKDITEKKKQHYYRGLNY